MKSVADPEHVTPVGLGLGLGFGLAQRPTPRLCRSGMQRGTRLSWCLLRTPNSLRGGWVVPSTCPSSGEWATRLPGDKALYVKRHHIENLFSRLKVGAASPYGTIKPARYESAPRTSPPGLVTCASVSSITDLTPDRGEAWVSQQPRSVAWFGYSGNRRRSDFLRKSGLVRDGQRRSSIAPGAEEGVRVTHQKALHILPGKYDDVA